MKNGLSVAAFTCFEHFVRERIAELLFAITSGPTLPPFQDLPEMLQTAATQGVVEAIRFRLKTRADVLDTAAKVSLVQGHAEAIRSSAGPSYRISEWAFGWSSSNVGAGVLTDFLAACGAGSFSNDFDKVLEGIGFDYSAAGLAVNNRFRLSRVGAWRHEAAHDATLSIDIELLRTRVTAYIAVALAFDYLASFAVHILIDSFGVYGSADRDHKFLRRMTMKPSAGGFNLADENGQVLRTLYSVGHGKAELSERDLPLDGVVVVEDAQGQVVDWFFR